MEEDGEGLTPFWMQRTTNRRSDRIRNGLSSTFFSSGLLITVLLVTAISLLVFVVPSTLSSLSISSRIFKPNSVKKSWDSINVLLVLVALLFGFLSRATNNNNNQKDEESDHHQTSSQVSRNIGSRKSNPPNEVQRSNHVLSSQRWYEYSDNLASSYNNPPATRCGLTLTIRTSSSYPDLASPRFMSGDDDPWRFYDDTGVDTYQLQPTETAGRRKSWKHKFEEDPRMAETKNNIYVDTFLNPPTNEASNLSPSPSRSPPASLLLLRLQPPSSALPDQEKLKSGYTRVEQKRERRSKRKGDLINELEDKEEPILSPAIHPPSPTLPPSVDQIQKKSSKTDKKKKKTSGGNSTKDIWNTLYHKKKQRQKSIEDFEALLHQPKSVPVLRFELPQQPHRSPPPPSSVFNHLFSANKSKRRRRPADKDISASKSSSSSQLNTAATTHLVVEPSTSQSKPVTSQKCQKPIKIIRSFDSVEENSNSGGESPLIPIPPPPPFAKSLSWKFLVQGDYVRVNSSISSRSGSPDSEETETESEGKPETPIGGADVTPLFFPSPDVNTKAENFISKFRAELKLEKINSMNNKRQGLLGMSSLSRVSGGSTQL